MKIRNKRSGVIPAAQMRKGGPMRDKRLKRAEENKNHAGQKIEWMEANLCENCGEAEHLYSCSKPDNITVEVWQNMTDDERLKMERK